MTAQLHERLILDGEMTSMAFCPPLPTDHRRIDLRLPDDVATEGQDSIFMSTACWRGYQGTWEIRDNLFYLTNLRGCFVLIGKEPLIADWFSGMLRVPKGKRLQYVHMGFGTVYEQEIHIKIENGTVVETRVIDNRGKKHDVEEIGARNLPGGENEFPGNEIP